MPLLFTKIKLSFNISVFKSGVVRTNQIALVCCPQSLDSRVYVEGTIQIRECMLLAPIRFLRICCAHPSDSLEYVASTHQIP